MNDPNEIALRYSVPIGQLEPMLTSFYDFRFEGAQFHQSERADYPQLRFQTSGDGFYEFHNGRKVQAAPVTIIGPTSRPRNSVANGPLHVCGFGMMPSGWDSLVKEDGYDWQDDAFDARQLLGDSVMDVWQALKDEDSFDGRIATIQRFADQIFPALDEKPEQFVRCVNEWLLASPSPNLDVLRAKTGLSARQVERLTKRYYGLPPKQLARKYRALRAAGIIATGGTLDSSELADAFYDQSHMTREIKQFTGFTPGQLKMAHLSCWRLPCKSGRLCAKRSAR